MKTMNKRFAVLVSLFVLAPSLLFAQEELRIGTSPVSGNLTTGGEVWYSIRPRSAGMLTVETSGSTDTYLEAFDSRRNKLMENDDGGEGTNARIQMVVMPGQSYLFKVRAYSADISGPYRIWATLDPMPNPVELRLDGGRVRGNITAGSNDWYSVRTRRGAGFLTVQTHGGSLDTYMYAYDSDYLLLKEDDDGGEGYNASISLLAEANRTYYFRVRGLNDEQIGPYEISADFVAVSDADRNTERSSASNIRLGEVTNIVFLAGETRWYRFEASRSATYTFQTRGSDVDTFMSLYDSRGNLIIEDDDSGTDLNALISQRLNAGTYFIAVRPYDNNSRGRHTLHVEMQ